MRKVITITLVLLAACGGGGTAQIDVGQRGIDTPCAASGVCV